MSALSHRTQTLISLGVFFKKSIGVFSAILPQVRAKNGWFEPEMVQQALHAWSEALVPEAVHFWLKDVVEPETKKKVGIVAAGNIPLVGLHDILSAYACGHEVYVKPSQDDALLYPLIFTFLQQSDASCVVECVDRLKGMDVVIGTGSSNTTRYFEQYFGHLPHLFRGTRHSAAWIDEQTSTEDLHLLGRDVFDYFGLGCRNVTHLLLPKAYDIQHIFKAWPTFSSVGDNKKYGNNYDYHRALYMMNGDAFLENGFVILRESPVLASPVSVVHWHRYESTAEGVEWLESQADRLQCVVGPNRLSLKGIEIVPYGKSQSPALWDYADRINTLDFLGKLNSA